MPAAASSAPPKLDIDPSSLKSLSTHLQSLTLHHRALVELQNHTNYSAIAAQKHQTSAAPVVEKLNEYPASGHVDLNLLVEWPPKLRPVPVKPLFLDTAWNYIEYPGRANAVTSGTAAVKDATTAAGKEEEKAQQKKKGWFGF